MRYSEVLGGGQQEAPIVLQADPGAESVEIPNGNFLLSADYSRVGPDLMLQGADGAQVLVQDYFALETPPQLTNAQGAEIWPELVESLAGPRAPGQLAQERAGRGTEPGDRIFQSAAGDETGGVSSAK